MIRRIALLGALIFALLPLSPQRAAAATTVPFEYANHHMVVTLTTATGETLNMLIDFGTEYGSITNEAAERAGAGLLPFHDRNDFKKTVDSVKLTVPQYLKIGDYAVPTQMYVASASDGWQKYAKDLGLGMRIDGDISYSAFIGHVVTFDFAKHTMEVSESVDETYAASVPLTIAKYSPAFERVLTFPVTVNGKAATASFDSVLGTSLGLLSAIGNGRATGPAAPFTIWALGRTLAPADCSALQLGAYTFPCAHTVVAGKVRPTDVVDLAIGNELWEKGKVTLDLRTMHLLYNPA